MSSLCSRIMFGLDPGQNIINSWNITAIMVCGPNSNVTWVSRAYNFLELLLWTDHRFIRKFCWLFRICLKFCNFLSNIHFYFVFDYIKLLLCFDLHCFFKLIMFVLINDRTPLKINKISEISQQSLRLILINLFWWVTSLFYPEDNVHMAIVWATYENCFYYLAKLSCQTLSFLKNGIFFT